MEEKKIDILLPQSNKREAEAMMDLLETMSQDSKEHIASYLEAIRLGYTWGRRSA